MSRLHTAICAFIALAHAAVAQDWDLQCWYRDLGATSNFSDGVSIPFI